MQQTINKETLVQDIESTRQQITDVLMEIDHINLQVNPQIEADYAIRIGCYENELLKAQIEARRAKRKLELAQARLNRGEDTSEGAIEDTLDEEFEAWEAQLSMQVQDYLSKLATKAGSRVLLPHEIEEIRALHRELVKRLHPDLHAKQADEERRLFDMVQQAYKHGSLDMLRSIEVATTYLAKGDECTEGSEEELAAELELLLAQLRVLQERLEALKSAAPYTFAERLADAEWIHKRTQGLKQEIERQQEVKRAYVAKYQELKGACNG